MDQINWMGVSCMLLGVAYTVVVALIYYNAGKMAGRRLEMQDSLAGHARDRRDEYANGVHNGRREMLVQITKHLETLK